MSDLPGPQTAASLAVMIHKYAQPGEGWREISNRVASTVADDSQHYLEFREIMQSMRFLMAGRNLTALGTTKRVTPFNCYVMPSIPDSLNGIFDVLKIAAKTMQMGGGVGYDFSPIRPRNDPVRSMEGRASGPVSYIQVYDSMGRTISSAGERRGAQMAVLRVDHPDIEEYILAKQNSDRLNTFNLSIAVTDSFMEAVRTGAPFDLQFEGRTYRTIDPRVLWETIMRSTWDWAEPGVLFIDRINHWNNLSYCETISATNPCSEQPLPPWGACLLGSINLPRYLTPLPRPSKLDGRFKFEWDLFIRDIRSIVRALDNVIDIALYPHEEQKKEAKSKRRMGIGVMGLANCIEAQGCPYGTEDFCVHTEKIMRVLANEAYFASACLADEKGKFPLYSHKILESPYMKQAISPAVRGRIVQSGLRNSHLISIAPTGTISFISDNVSSGIEPVLAIRERRRVKMPSGDVEYDVQDYGSSMGVEPRTVKDVTAEEHVRVLCSAQKYVDSAVSKTCNVLPDMEWGKFKEIYQRVWEGGGKGCSTYQVGGKRAGIRAEVTDCEGGKCGLG